MKREIAEAIVSAGQENFSEEQIRLRDNYSGRGMFGKNTTGIVVDNDGILLKSVAIASARWNEADSTGDAPFSFERFVEGLSMSRDSMGQALIVY